jgi:archaellum component FlaC
MSKNLTQRLTSDTSIDRFNDKLNDMEERFKGIGDLFSNISLSDLDVEYVDGEIKSLTDNISNLKSELNSSMDEGFKGALTGAT